MKYFLLRLWHTALIPGLILAVLTSWLLQLIWPVDQAIARILYFTIAWNVVIYAAVATGIVWLLV